MNFREVIAEFCSLATEVGQFLKHEFSSDCFCKGDRIGFSFDIKIFDYIKSAVKEKMAGNYSVNFSPETLKANIVPHIQWLYSKNEKIQAIKFYRCVFGVGLKEAKDACDAIGGVSRW